MKLKYLLWLLLLTCSLSGGEIPTGSIDSWLLRVAEKRQQFLKSTEYSPEIGKVLEISMVPSVFSYVELNLREPVPIAANAGELDKLGFTLELLAKPAESVTAVSVRLIDATGEIFQYRAASRLRAGAWSRIAIPLKKPSSVWGGNRDRKLDYPVRFSAVTVDCRRETVGNVTLMIDNLEFHQ